MDRSMGCRKREHQDAKDWHQFVGPNESRNANQIQLDNQANNLIHCGGSSARA
jgi:hypothetical protein